VVASRARDRAGFCAQAAQLTGARAEFGWLRDGSQMVQQQALRDFAQAMTNYFAGILAFRRGRVSIRRVP
jgi:putative transposase